MKTASTPRAWSRDWTDAGHTVEEYDYRVRASEWADAFRWAAENGNQRAKRKAA